MAKGDTEDISAAAQVTDWLAKGLPSVLPKGVEPNLSKLALAGHSKGGHTAFSLVLGHGQTKLKFSAIIGVDPVAGKAEYSQISPKILTYEPSSLDIGMPALVIGTGLGEESKEVFWIPVGPCAPKGVNHRQFYHECKPPCYHFVTKDFGHFDMIDDDAPIHIKLMKAAISVEGNGSKDMMRRTVAGIMVAFLKAKLNEEEGDLEAILKDPKLAPATLDPVEHRLA